MKVSVDLDTCDGNGVCMSICHDVFDVREDGLHVLQEEAPEVVAPVIAADPEYLATLYDEFDRSHGGIDAYLARVIGVDAEALERLRALLAD